MRIDNAAMGPRDARSLMRSMAVRAGINQVACLAIAVVLWMFGVDPGFWVGLVFSLVIGNCCWLLIDVGRALAARWRFVRKGGLPDWPGWGWMAPIVVIGSVGGYVIGQALARALLGLPDGQGHLHAPILVFSVIVALTVSYLFYARERMHTQHLQALAAERLASETQLKLLQSQLEPHMLFNTLANLRVLIGLDAAQAQAMLDHLIAFLRTTLASTRIEHHPLATEFAALQDYLALMAVRMGPRLQSGFELPPDLAALPVPPLLLQPLVENAIKHGLEPQVQGGRIDVSARRSGDRLLLRVADSGAGPGAAPCGGSSFGLEQVRQRLKALHGERASLALRGLPEGGTEAVVTLPIDAHSPATPSP